MAGANVTKREIVVPKTSLLAMANRFGRYKPEEEKTVRKAEVVEDEMLKRLKIAWKVCSYTGNAVKDYPKMLETVKKLRHSAKDVERFSLALAEFQGEERFSESAGLFLSALINSCRSRKFVIHTHHLAKPIHHLGFANTKSIAVKGDAGRDVGPYMKNGTITVEGNAGVGVGEHMEGGTITVKGNADEDVGLAMEGGAIIVEGNAGDEVGWGMKGGIITVKGDASNGIGFEMKGGAIIVEGNAGDLFGHEMAGGEIHLNGDYGSLLGNIEHGKIYHKGKLIVDK
jgi:glutamate synthase domain-containing protein 3